MPMDPESPFAHLGGGSTKFKKLGFRYIGKMICKGTPTKPGCQNEWNVPVTSGGAVASACPKCHRSTGLILMDGSVQEAPPPKP